MIKRGTPPQIQEFRINNLNEYIEIIERIVNRNPNKTIIYRGQSQDKDLLPSIARYNEKIDTTETEKEILEEFKRRSRLKIKLELIDDWDWLIYAQHFGLKTRLLDWSSNPLVGMWFCCSNKDHWNKDGVIYIFIAEHKHLVDRKLVKSPFDRNTTRVYKPYLNNERIIAQSGWFTAHGFSTTAEAFVRLNKNTYLKKQLTKVFVPMNLKEKLVERLNLMGINYERLFPDIEGICKQLNLEYKL